MQLVKSTTTERVMATFESNIERTVSKLEDRLELWAAKLNELAAKTEVKSQETKIEARARLEEAEARLAVARTKLDEAKIAGAERWDKFKAGVESAWKELETAFDKLTH
jgi:division protein CdvB (Snf7/Vps24/ESCRT-III family)